MKKSSILPRTDFYLYNFISISTDLRVTIMMKEAVYLSFSEMNSLEIDINALCVMWISEVLYSRFPVVSKQKKCHCHSAALGGGLEGGILICTPEATRR